MSRRALLSVSDRTGLAGLGRDLVALGFELVSTGGTASALSDAGLPVTPVSDVTGFPEVFGGRVKTLHPALFGGVLYDRSVATHREEAEANGIAPIDLVAVNLYPFEETLDRTSDPAELVARIDVGGPALLRAAAKNHAHVTVLCDPVDYAPVVAELGASGETSPGTRRRLAAKVFRRVAGYDAAIARWLTTSAGDGPFPERLSLSFERVGGELRYGENPHQRAALYRERDAPPAALARFTFLQGKELSHNNLLDADAALFTSRAVGPGGLTIVKHRIPSGVALGESPFPAFEAAWASDPVAGFGGVVAYTGILDEPAARAIASRFLEVVIAYGVSDEARAVLATKPNLRVLTVAPDPAPRPRIEVRSVDGGLLVQESDVLPDEDAGRVVSSRAPSPHEARALLFASRAVRGVVSNGIVVAGENATFGIGGGRTSRVDACRDAVAKAGERARGAVAASDAFFPFPDGLEVLAAAGVTAIVQPGGSVKDADVIAAADARGLAMVFTGRRHFRH